MGGLGRSIIEPVTNPIHDDRRVDPARELTEVLSVVGLDPLSGGGEVAFMGRDPVVKSALPLATMAAVGLMAKAVSIADLWRFRGGTGQDLAVSLGQVLHRLCPFYDRKWELLNGYPPGNPADPTNPFMPTNMCPTRDGRQMLLVNIHPALKTKALAFFGCIRQRSRKWDAFAVSWRIHTRQARLDFLPVVKREKRSGAVTPRSVCGKTARPLTVLTPHKGAPRSGNPASGAGRPA